MRKSGFGFAIAASASAVALLGTGIANAAPDPVAGAYQLCGTAYSGAALVDTHPPSGTPSGAVPRSGVTVTGTLVGGTSTTYTATTNASGQYCLTGNASMVSTILGGGYVTISAPGAVAASHPAGIFTADFIGHQTGPTSATGFNLVF
ncbi:hypothetical protein [Rhodococcus maanshanensis]|uniref:Carboxypeptidase regulatory-like domain-containing protein n=1 Tax=Rhodococcus maanshanensis TaxID=183556 RepID=A0A1H7Q626_9NOCA|nr:hypothetical protein [Rhodococcus maanshanensis]SEL43188.1 hypothetical protein SAMN05444583_10945 [Rhodococcus maanshanensis]